MVGLELHAPESSATHIFDMLRDCVLQVRVHAACNSYISVFGKTLGLDLRTCTAHSCMSCTQ